VISIGPLELQTENPSIPPNEGEEAGVKAEATSLAINGIARAAFKQTASDTKRDWNSIF
jgi:hypothetical protein